jgi:hypothetical protein
VNANLPFPTPTECFHPRDHHYFILGLSMVFEEVGVAEENGADCFRNRFWRADCWGWQSHLEQAARIWRSNSPKRRDLVKKGRMKKKRKDEEKEDKLSPL